MLEYGEEAVQRPLVARLADQGAHESWASRAWWNSGMVPSEAIMAARRGAFGNLDGAGVERAAVVTLAFEFLVPLTTRCREGHGKPLCHPG